MSVDWERGCDSANVEADLSIWEGSEAVRFAQMQVFMAHFLSLKRSRLTVTWESRKSEGRWSTDWLLATLLTPGRHSDNGQSRAIKIFLLVIITKSLVFEVFWFHTQHWSENKDGYQQRISSSKGSTSPLLLCLFSQSSIGPPGESKMNFIEEYTIVKSRRKLRYYTNRTSQVKIVYHNSRAYLSLTRLKTVKETITEASKLLPPKILLLGHSVNLNRSFSESYPTLSVVLVSFFVELGILNISSIKRDELM